MGKKPTSALTDQQISEQVKLVRRLVVAVLAPALGQYVLFVRLYHREPLDFPKITAEAGFSHHVRISSRQPAHDLHPLQATSPAN